MALKTEKKQTKIIRRKSGAKPNMYFNEKTTAAIVSYKETADPDKKKKIYLAEIYPAFDKLVENLIRIYRFQSMHDSYDDLKNDCVTFLYEAINKFDTTRGFKPFSYFNVVAKHWLIIRSKQRVNKMKKIVSIDDEMLNKTDRDSIDDHYVVPSQDDQIESIEFILRIHALLEKIKSKLVTENEIKCIDAVIRIFKVVKDYKEKPGEDLLLNKRAVFFLIREISGLNPKQLTMTIALLKRHYRDLKNSDECGIY